MVTKSKNFAIPPLDPSLTPADTSTALINLHLDAFVAKGNPQKAVNLAMDVASPFISALKNGDQLVPLSRLLELADILGLVHADRVELIHTRLVEQHGRNGDFSLHVVAEWALEMARPTAARLRPPVPLCPWSLVWLPAAVPRRPGVTGACTGTRLPPQR